MTNNGSLTFTYAEARNKYKMTDGQFRRAIDDLRDKGFLDITESGSGLEKSTNKYFLSGRWREYGTPEYKSPKPRPHGPINKGFRKGNQHGLNCREKLKTTVMDNKEAIVTSEHASEQTGSIVFIGEHDKEKAKIDVTHFNG